MKETPEMIELGVLAVDFNRVHKKIARIKKLAKICRKQAVASGKFRNHQFSGFMATLSRTDAAIDDIGQAHSDVSDLLELNGIEMCSDDDFVSAQKTLSARGGNR